MELEVQVYICDCCEYEDIEESWDVENNVLTCPKCGCVKE